MDFCQNVSFSGENSPRSSSLDDLISSQNMEVDVNLEWLSIFVEDCLSSKGNCLPPPANVHTPTTTMNPTKLSSSLHKFIVPNKAISKRKRTGTVKTKNRLTSWSRHLNLPNQALHTTSSDWLAQSELIVPKKETIIMKNSKQEDKVGLGSLERRTGHQQPRRCTHCQSQRTPQWRAGPLGPKTLCNACGVRYKSGRLVPEYRPAKSPTFVSYLHSNSHKKVMQMRMDIVSSVPNEQSL